MPWPASALASPMPLWSATLSRAGGAGPRPRPPAASRRSASTAAAWTAQAQPTALPSTATRGAAAGMPASARSASSAKVDTARRGAAASTRRPGSARAAAAASAGSAALGAKTRTTAAPGSVAPPPKTPPRSSTSPARFAAASLTKPPSASSKSRRPKSASSKGGWSNMATVDGTDASAMRLSRAAASSAARSSSSDESSSSSSGAGRGDRAGDWGCAFTGDGGGGSSTGDGGGRVFASDGGGCVDGGGCASFSFAAMNAAKPPDLGFPNMRGGDAVSKLGVSVFMETQPSSSPSSVRTRTRAPRSSTIVTLEFVGTMVTCGVVVCSPSRIIAPLLGLTVALIIVSSTQRAALEVQAAHGAARRASMRRL